MNFQPQKEKVIQEGLFSYYFKISILNNNRFVKKQQITTTKRTKEEETQEKAIKRP